VEIKILRSIKTKTESDLQKSINETLEKFYQKTGVKPTGCRFDFNPNDSLKDGVVTEPVIYNLRIALDI